MKKTIRLLILGMIMLITLTGCISVDYSIKINEDGSGQISYVYAYSKEYLNNMDYTGDELTEELKEDAINEGYNVEPYSDETKEGIRILKDVEDVTKDISLSDLFEDYVAEDENNNIKMEKKGINTIFSQNASIDLTEMTGVEEYVKITYEIKLPCKVKSCNADEISEDCKTIKWNLKPGEINEINFESKGTITNFVPIIVVVIIVVCMILIAVLIYFLLKKNIIKTKEKTNNK